eukprot:COSAG01_NODE_70214_length_259_cov_0.650000_1_plen_27_part_10
MVGRTWQTARRVRNLPWKAQFVEGDGG